MIIAQISDTHIDLDSPNCAARLANLEQCVADINRLDPLPDVVIHTGDMAHDGTPEDYAAVKPVLDALRCPLYVAAGNRDDRAALRAAFPVGRDLLPGTPFLHYSVDTFPVRLIAVDTLSDHGNQGDFCRVRSDGLRAALAEDPSKPTVVFMHHPPFEVTESDYPHQFDPWEAVAEVGRALEGQTHVVAVFCGHAHRDAPGEIAGVPVASTPSVAVDLRLGDYPPEVEAVPLYKIHRFDGQRFVGEVRAVREREALAAK